MPILIAMALSGPQIAAVKTPSMHQHLLQSEKNLPGTNHYSRRHLMMFCTTTATSMRSTTTAITAVNRPLTTTIAAATATIETVANAASHQTDEADGTATTDLSRGQTSHLRTPTTAPFTNSGDPKLEIAARHVPSTLVQTTRIRITLAKTTRIRETSEGGADSRISSSPR